MRKHKVHDTSQFNYKGYFDIHVSSKFPVSIIVLENRAWLFDEREAI